jgi:hypothetical protein
MERAEAEAILDGDRKTAVALLMRIGELVEANRRLEARVAELEQRVGCTNSIVTLRLRVREAGRRGGRAV